MRLSLLTILVSALIFAAFAGNSVVLDCGIKISQVKDVANGSMDIELFNGGTLSREQKLAFMPDGKAPSSVNVFLVETGGKTYLIDAGFGNAIKDKRLDVSKIDAVIVSHAHSDHITGLLKEDKTAAFSVPVFINKIENDYWLNPKTENSDLQKNVAKIYEKEKRYKKFSWGDTLAPGIVAIDASGHTPGHTAFLIGTGKNKLLIAGDFLHAAALQFPNPDESARFDIDRKKAANMRKKLIKMAIDNDWLIGGMHIPEGFGKVKDNGNGGFEFFGGSGK
jgi:glyoxylase-like metal-dependent hydrolase (beta-lactamase superfamily II)